MRWAFWRGKAARKGRPDDAPPLPEDVGLPTTGLSSPRGARTPDDPDDAAGARPATRPFSGASPDAADAPPSRRQASGRLAPSLEPTPDEPAATDAPSRRAACDLVLGVVGALLDADRAAFDTALAPATARAPLTPVAAACAQQALAARLPALSGITGDVVFDEPQDELLHAYADLLAERAEPLRRRVAAADLREVISRVAHLAATAADEQQEHEPAVRGQRSVLLSPDLEPRQQLVAACVLLAQTVRDGGGSRDDLVTELADMADLADGPSSG